MATSRHAPLALPLRLLTLLGLSCWCGAQTRYQGREIGALSQLHHGVRGRVFAVDARTIHLPDLHYDGEGPAAYFYVGKSKAPSSEGAHRLRDERGGAGPLRRYRGESVTLALPDGLSLKDVRWFAIYCDEYAVNFGDVRIPRELEYPKPAKVGALRGVHGVWSEPVVVVDAQTLLVPHFSYDGEAPDAKFWVGRGESPSPQGIRIPDENGKETPLRKYDKKTIVLTLPGELTVFDIGHFGVWCEAFTVDFGHVPLPRAALHNVPPSLKMLGVSPQSKLNCEVLLDELAFEARWAVAGDSIVIQLVAKLEDGEYMSFGISGDPHHSQMVGGDVAVAWLNQTTLKGNAVDYYLDAKSQCAGTHGSCPDEHFVEGTNSVRPLNAALVNGYSIVTYQRSLRAADGLDLPVLTNASQPVIWAIGPLNSHNEVSYHHHYTKGDKFIEFGRPPRWNCPMPETEEERRAEPAPTTPLAPATPAPLNEPAPVLKPRPVPTPKPVPKSQPWEIPAIQCYEPPDGVFYAQMGPTGGKQGYSAITGHVGWGISWYINGLLIPEINVVRGKKYTFVVEGGSDPAVPARYHPFYITNDPVGGYQHKSADEKKGIEIYAGVRRLRSGAVSPAGAGRLCNWTPDSSGPDADEYPSFGAYQRSLTLVCEEGSPGVVTWTPDAKTPDTVYYQCFTHRHLGWKINVVDECDAEEAEESRVAESVALPDDLRSEESVQVHSRLTPDTNFLDQRKKLEKIINTKTNYDDFSSYKEGELTGEVYRDDKEQPYRTGPRYELPISNGQMKEVIQAVESLETKMKDDMKGNATHLTQHGHGPGPLSLAYNGHGGHNSHQYQVQEDVREMFMPEQPIREDDEYFVEGKVPNNYFLPPNQKPLTLQSVLRPNGPNKQHGNMRPPFRRPVPPEIKLRRPPPMHQKNTNTGYPLPMPNVHNQYVGMKKSQNSPHKFNNNRPPINRPPPVGGAPGIPPMKAMPQLHTKPMFNQISKQGTKSNPAPTPQAPVMIIMANSKQVPTNLPTQSQTLSLGQTDIIANQVVKSHIMLPGGNDAIAQHSIPQTYMKPGQIILGKPMEHPMPLDQQMIQTKPLPMRSPPTPSPLLFQSSTFRIKLENELPILNDIKSSDFIGESVDSSTLAPAVNTGFRPESIVVESGFKPIIREPLMAAEDRIAEYETSVNRREDTDIVEDYEESPQPLANYAPSSEKLTESFEPMFIPSPPDHLLAVNERTKEVFPRNHAKEDRPHPVYVKTENELNALFSKKNMERDVPLDMVMESDRVSPHYLPPDPKLPKEQSQKLSMGEQTFTTYDGKTVSAATLTSVPDLNKTSNKFSSKLPANSELLLKTPQFGPFKGEIPPPVAAHINKDPQPPSKDTAPAQDSRTTNLKLVNLHKSSEVLDDLEADGSEINEVTQKPDDLDEEEDYEEEEEEADKKRQKRNARKTHSESSAGAGEGAGEARVQSHAQSQAPINGHSLPISQMYFETSAASARTLCTHLVLLALCVKLF